MADDDSNKKAALGEGPDRESSNEGVPPEQLPVNSVVEVFVSEDALSAFVKVIPPQNGGEPPSEVEVFKALGIKKITYGVRTERIKLICESPVYGQSVIVAEGVGPVAGVDAELIFKVDVSSKPKPVEREDGSVDFANMNLFVEVEKGQVLCERTPPTPGTLGTNVYGKPIPAIAGRDKPLPSGSNTAILEGEKQLIAVIDGRVSFVAGRISVSKDFLVKGDVNTGTGDINFKGNITVEGNVTRGRKVEATGNVDVFGMIEGATVIAGGDIIVRGGIVNGGATCLVQCLGSLNCRYMEGVTAIAIKDVRAQMIMHSQVKCGNLVELFGSKGALIGGECLCGGNIILRAAGSPAHIKTKLEVGRDPTLVIRENALDEEVEQINKTLGDLDRLEGVLNQLKAMNRLSEEKAEMLASVQTTQQAMHNKLNMISKELKEIKKRIWSTIPVEIVVTGMAYAGVEIKIGAAFVVLDTDMPRKRFSRSDDMIIAK